MNIIDTHAHIYLSDFADDREEVLNRAKEAGVSKILLPGIDSSTHAEMLALEASRPETCISMMGLHPCSVKDNYRKELGIIEEYLKTRSFIAIGEIGLDFHWDLSFRKQQYEAFEQQIEWALQYDLPISIHSRDATNECIEIIEKYQHRGLRGVFHCFSGNLEQAHRAIATGFYLGIGGVVTFKNAGLQQVLSVLELDRVVLETDAPYLTPAPYRGKRNESAYLSYVISKLAEIKRVYEDEIAAITSANAKHLFAC